MVPHQYSNVKLDINMRNLNKSSIMVRLTNPLNPYFKNYSYTPEQRLVEDLAIESIKQFGIVTYYIPQNVDNLDKLFGESPTSTYEQCTSIEIYVLDSENGYSGDGRIMAKFGLEIKESIELIVTTRRFKQIASKSKLYTENGYLFLNEGADVRTQDGYSGFLLEDGNLNNFELNYDRPRSGDIIYLPMMDKFFEIEFCHDYDHVFYQLGKIPFYKLSCNIFEYSHEKFSTGINEVDGVNTFYGDSRISRIINEDGTQLLMEDGESTFINESYEVENYDPSADNDLIYGLNDDVIDFSETSPFTVTDANDKF